MSTLMSPPLSDDSGPWLKEATTVLSELLTIWILAVKVVIPMLPPEEISDLTRTTVLAPVVVKFITYDDKGSVNSAI